MQRQAVVLSLEALEAELAGLRAAGKTIVHCHGVFDLVHIGHIRHFEEASRMGDVLVVTITPDRHVNKGPGRPAFPEELRAEAVASLGMVDYVAINRWPQAIEAIRALRPHVYVKGEEYRAAEQDRTGGIVLEEQAVREVGGRIAFTGGLTSSSSALLNRHMPVLPREATDYLSDFAGRWPTDEVLRYLDAAGSLKVLVLGEAIIDDYHYCESMGKTGKEPILATRFVSSERFAGGVLAVANHLASFAGSVRLLTALGANNSEEPFVREHLHPRVSPTFVYMEDAPTIVKRRFVETYPLQKLFEVYHMQEGTGTNGYHRELCTRLAAAVREADVVVVNDYGHGLLNPEAIELLCREARFLAVNTQVNAANHGFNTVSKYPRADYVAVSEAELRLDARSRRGPLTDIVKETASRMGCGNLVVTQGQKGALCYSDADGFRQIPAFTGRIVDRVGAGDAVFAVTALCVAQGAPIEVAGVIGNAVGAQAVMTVGNREAIDRVKLSKHLTALLRQPAPTQARPGVRHDFRQRYRISA